MQDADSKPAEFEATVLPDDLDSCHALILQQAQAILAAQQSRETLGLENEELKAYVQRLLHQIYGRRREVRKGRPQPRQEKFPEHYPRVEETVEPPVEQRECPEHGPKQVIGYDSVETLEIERPKFRVRVRKYPKYACPNQPECGVLQAPRPVGLVEGCRYDTSVAAEVIANKYAYHLPLYREQDLFAGSGWTPSRSTLVNLLAASAEVFQPLSEHLRQLLLGRSGLGCDETRITLIVPPIPPPPDPADPRSARAHEVLREAIERQRPSVSARMWAYRAFDLPVNVFDFTVSRHRDGPDEMLRDYTGLLMADCYSGFEGIALRSDARIVRAACWAHARRKIFEIRVNHPQTSSVLLARIGQLYDIEDRGKELSADARLELRQRESRPVLACIREYLDHPAIRDALPQSDLAKAAGYLRNHWEALLQYTGDGRCPIDNNDVEQLMKQVAVGRKNWLFVGSLAGGHRAATLMTIVSTAIRNDLDVAVYLKDALDQLLAGSTDYASLCPHVWKLEHPDAVRTYRAEERRDAADRKRLRRARRRLLDRQ